MSTETAARNELDVEGEAALYRAFRKFWHPVAYARTVVDRPQRVTLLGEYIVIARLAGEVRAFPDLCLHRGSALWLGTVEDDCLRCAYHGWAYDAEGRSVDVPARRELSGKINATLHRYRVAEAAGLIWVRLAKRRSSMRPPSPSSTIREFRVLEGPPYDWATSAPRRMENFVDFSHFSFVHEGVLGSRDNPRVEDTDVSREGGVLRFARWVSEPGEAHKKMLLGIEAETMSVLNEYNLTMPGTIHLKRTFPNGRRYILVMAACPMPGLPSPCGASGSGS